MESLWTEDSAAHRTFRLQTGETPHVANSPAVTVHCPKQLTRSQYAASVPKAVMRCALVRSGWAVTYAMAAASTVQNGSTPLYKRLMTSSIAEHAFGNVWLVSITTVPARRRTTNYDHNDIGMVKWNHSDKLQ